MPYNAKKQINKHLLIVRLSGESNTIAASISRCDEVIDILRQQREGICAFHVATSFLFGAVAGDEAKDGSDNEDLPPLIEQVRELIEKM